MFTFTLLFLHLVISSPCCFFTLLFFALPFLHLMFL